MRIITDKKEIEEIEVFIDVAANYALDEKNLPKCKKSLRGAVIVRDNCVLGLGWNMPTLEDLTCKPVCLREQNHSDANYDDCSAIHAEEMAIFDAFKKGNILDDARIYHIKVKNGKPVATGSPSCVKCGIGIYRSGISEIVLLEEDGYHIYNAKEFDELSIKHHMKK